MTCAATAVEMGQTDVIAEPRTRAAISSSMIFEWLYESIYETLSVASSYGMAGQAI